MNNMKPFDLQKFLDGEPVICRGGIVPSEVHYFETDNTDYPICVISNGNSHWVSNTGKFNKELDSYYDLFMKPKVKTYWVNVYRKNDRIEIGAARKSIEDAESWSQDGMNFVKTISFEVEDE